MPTAGPHRSRSARAKAVLAELDLQLHNLLLLAVAPRTPFPDMDRFAFAPIFEQNWEAVRAEVTDLLDHGPEIPGYMEVDPSQKQFWDLFARLVGRARPASTAAGLDRWQTFVFRTYGRDVDVNRARCPATAALLDQVPGLSGAMFSVLNPGVKVPPHFGLFLGALRMHLGVLVPPGRRSGLKVAGEVRHWEEGTAFVFEHTRWHSAWNEADRPRVILILDFERPLRWRWLERRNHRIVSSLAASPRAAAAVAAVTARAPSGDETGAGSAPAEVDQLASR